MRKPLRRLKIQDELDENLNLGQDFIDDGSELTLLSAINCIVTLATSLMWLATSTATTYKCCSTRAKWTIWSGKACCE